MGFLDWLRLIFGTEQFNAHMNAMKLIGEEKDKKIAELEKIKEEYEKMKGHAIGIAELEIFLDREKETLQQFIECVKEKRDLKEEIIFLKIDLERLRKQT